MSSRTLKTTKFVLCLWAALMFAAGTVSAQEEKIARGPIVTGMVTSERLRIAAPNAVVQLRLEVYDEAGEKLLDTEQRGGNVLDWHLQDRSGQRVADGTYLCVVTIKNLSGRLSQKLGQVTVSAKATQLRSAAVAELSPRQAHAIGPVEGEEELTVLPAEDAQPVTVLANKGDEAQLTRTRGALTFRVGDFFSGTDKEQMRLTEEGNLGIGSSKPQFKLDVAGTIRARQGFVFNDGSTLNVNDQGMLTRTTSDGTVTPSVGGIGTQGRLAKWTDNAGTLGDSVAIDTGTGLQLTVAPSASVDTNLLYLNSTNGTTGVLAGNVPSYGAANGPFFAMRGNNYTTIANQRGLFTISAGNVGSPVGDDGSVKFNTGNDQLRMVIKPNGRVGIGVDDPAKRLDVAGDINVSGDYNIDGDRVFSIDFANSNTFAGIAAGPVNTGFNNSFFGARAGSVNTSGRDNSFFGAGAGQSTVAQPGNSFFGSNAGRDNTANANSFFGSGAGILTTGGGANTFIGVDAGQTNKTGIWNTALGGSADVGANNLDHATAIGAEAVVSSSNTIVLGRSNASDTVIVPGKLEVDTMGASGGSQLCLNGSNRLALCSSSLRYKTAVLPFLRGLNIINRLHPIAFTWKDNGVRDLGLGAEEVERIEPLLTFRNKQGEIEGVKYNQLSAVFVNAFKEQQQQIEALQQQLRQQHSEVVALTRSLCRNHRHSAVCRR
jgi:hypothetical protein